MNLTQAEATLEARENLARIDHLYGLLTESHVEMLATAKKLDATLVLLQAFDPQDVPKVWVGLRDSLRKSLSDFDAAIP